MQSVLPLACVFAAIRALFAPLARKMDLLHVCVICQTATSVTVTERVYGAMRGLNSQTEHVSARRNIASSVAAQANA